MNTDSSNRKMVRHPQTQAGRDAAYNYPDVPLSVFIAIEDEARDQGVSTMTLGDAAEISEQASQMEKDRIKTSLINLPGFWHPLDDEEAMTDKTKCALIARSCAIEIVEGFHE